MFTINGTQVAEPKIGGIKIKQEPVWASNTGRNTKGKMIGDIITWKTTLDVTWPPLSFAKLWKIYKAIADGGDFFDIQYTGIKTEWDDSTKKLVVSGTAENPHTTVTKKVYCGNIPALLYSLSQEYPRYDEVTIQFIEQ